MAIVIRAISPVVSAAAMAYGMVGSREMDLLMSLCHSEHTVYATEGSCFLTVIRNRHQQVLEYLRRHKACSATTLTVSWAHSR
jgi:hypothetical protein